MESDSDASDASDANDANDANDASDASDASDVEMEDAPPTSWGHLSWWVETSGRAQRGLVGGYSRAKPPRKCRLDRTAAKAAAAAAAAAAARLSSSGRQTTLLAHARPARWTATSMALNADAIETVVLHLMAQSDARTLRALAVVNRECMAIVSGALRRACDACRHAARRFAEAQEKQRSLSCDSDEMCHTTQRRAEAAECQRVARLDEYEIAMAVAGVHHHRRHALVRKPDARWFHGSTSLFGHMQKGCELCSSEEASDTGHRAGPVALFACRKCAHNNRVRFSLQKAWEDRTFHHPKGQAQRLTVRFPRYESEANNYACALMSKRESRRRRMAGSHMPRARRTVSLSRRVHPNQKWTNELEASWQLWSDEAYGRDEDADEMPFELWHALPEFFFSDLTFASVMGLGSAGEDARVQASNHTAARRRARATVDARRAAFNRVAHTHRELIRRVNLLVRERGFRAWLQVIDLCCAARAFELRWLFRADESRFGDWRKARYQLLDMHPAALVDAAHRISSATHVLHRVFSSLCFSDGSALGPTDSSLIDSTRACVTEILKHLPMGLLRPGREDALYAKVQHLHNAHLWLTLVLDESQPAHNNQRLRIEVKIAPRIVERANLVLYAILTKYTIARLCSLVDVPENTDRLSPETLLRIQQRANNWGSLQSRDHARAVLYGLPGAWPYACTWEQNA